MPRQSIEQAKCDCGAEGEFTVTDTEFPYCDNDEKVDAIKYTVRCECGDTGVIVVAESGTRASDGITYDDASWNNVEEEAEEAA